MAPVTDVNLVYFVHPLDLGIPLHPFAIHPVPSIRCIFNSSTCTQSSKCQNRLQCLFSKLLGGGVLVNKLFANFLFHCIELMISMNKYGEKNSPVVRFDGNGGNIRF